MMRTKLSIVAVGVLVAGTVWAGASVAAPAPEPPASGPDTRAQLFATVAGADPGVFGNTPFVPDDITIDKSGDMYIADYQGTPTDPTGRIVFRGPDGAVTVPVPGGLSHPNGIVFTADQTALWIDQDLSGTLNHVGYQY